jgi:hypothetical protein
MVVVLWLWELRETQYGMKETLVRLGDFAVKQGRVKRQAHRFAQLHMGLTVMK